MSDPRDQLLHDLILEHMLPAQMKNIYERSLAYVAHCYSVGEPNEKGQRDGDPVNRRLWGLANRVVEYGEPTQTRTTREGKVWSYAEEKVLKWAFNPERPKECKGKEKPDVAYIAKLLQRTEREVKLKLGIVKDYTKGFGL